MLIAFHPWVKANVDPLITASGQRKRVVGVIGMRDDAGQRDAVVLEDRLELEDVGGVVAAVEMIVGNARHHSRAFLPRDDGRRIIGEPDLRRR